MRSSIKIIFTVFALSVCLSLANVTIAQPEPNAPAKSQDGIMLNFKDATLETVLQYLSEVAGLVVVADDLLSDRMTVISRKPLNMDEAIALINTILKERDYAAIRLGRTLRIVLLDEAKRMNIPVRSGNDPDNITPGDDLVTYVIPIRHADAVKLKEDLSSLIPEYADLTANQDGNVLIITDTTANVKRLIEIVQALDTHLSDVAEVRVFHLQYSDATDTAELINEIFEQDQSSSSGRRGGSGGPFDRMRMFMTGGRPGGGGRPGSDRSQQSQTGGLSVKVTAAADERTNTVVISAPADTMEVIATVIKDLDSNPEAERTIFLYRLKNARAENLKEVLNNLFSEMEELSTRGSSGSSGRSQRDFSGRQTSSRSSNNQSKTDLSDEVYFEADEDTNTLLIMTSSKNYAKVKAILDDLDKPVPQVLIKVLIAEVTHSDSIDLGMEFSILNMRHDSDSLSLGTDFGLAQETGGLIIRSLEGDVDVALHAMEEVGKLDILSRPYILTSNNQTASIIVGEEVPFIRDTRITETGQTINTIEYEDIGIILEVTPFINPDGLVIMDVKPEISTTTAETVQISAGVNASVFAKRSSESRVAIKDGQTIVIGGLIEDQLTESVEKVPLLGDIPLLGFLFQRTIKEKEKTELLIFLTPHVASNDDQLEALTQTEKANTQLLKDSVEPGTLEKHLKEMN
ncbi:MAG: type II secretion system secretin GspD [Planctomycetota bacterium]|jgi:general secretion pathway protein D